ncbi:MAG: hypothetical protein SGJ04_00905 [Bacteroidota bacterium]|nr:hypothetical protein [Bacteroidota bacterium]
MGFLNELSAEIGSSLFKDERIKTIIDEMMQTVRDILNQFEGILHQIKHIANIIIDTFRQAIAFIKMCL